MYYLIEAGTGNLVTKQAEPFDAEYITKQAEKLGKVLEVTRQREPDNLEVSDKETWLA